jgi:polyisoprenoid-binding protein YceI
VKRWTRLQATRHSWGRWLLLAALGASAALPAQAEPVVVDRFDTNHSTVGFSVPILGGLSEVEGKFVDFKVVLHYDAADITHSSVEATIAATSIDTGIPDRDKDLRGPGFFDVGVFPEIQFVSASIERKGGDDYVAHGTLTLHGVKKPTDIPFTLKTQRQGEKTVLSIRGDLTLDRTEFGIAWHHPVKDFVSDKVNVRLRLLTKQVQI